MQLVNHVPDKVAKVKDITIYVIRFYVSMCRALVNYLPIILIMNSTNHTCSAFDLL